MADNQTYTCQFRNGVPWVYDRGVWEPMPELSEKKLINASTVARIAGNIASGLAHRFLLGGLGVDEVTVARDCVSMARAIAAEVERTEPATERQETS